MIAPRNAEAMGGLPLWRLYLLRAMYLVMAVGLGLVIWPRIISHGPDWPLMSGVTACLLGAVGLLSVLGLVHPVRMIPILLFELAWKAIWLAAVALPLWRAGTMDAATMETVSDCALVVLVVLVMPWRYVFATYLTAPGERWR